MREAEQRLRAAPRAKLRLDAGVGLFAYLNENETWLERLADRYGPRFDIVADDRLEERSYDLSG